MSHINCTQKDTYHYGLRLESQVLKQLIKEFSFIIRIPKLISDKQTTKTNSIRSYVVHA